MEISWIMFILFVMITIIMYMKLPEFQQLFNNTITLLAADSKNITTIYKQARTATSIETFIIEAWKDKEVATISWISWILKEKYPREKKLINITEITAKLIIEYRKFKKLKKVILDKINDGTLTISLFILNFIFFLSFSAHNKTFI